MNIGIFDSGIGGLSVLHHALKIIPHANFIYYADRKNVPYGEKSVFEIQTFIEEIMDFFVSKKVDALVIACNTASSVATKEYRNKFPFPIIGMEPAVKKAVETYTEKQQRILVAATPITIQGNKLRQLLNRVDKHRQADLIALPKLVHFAELKQFDSLEVEEYIKTALNQYCSVDYSAIVLGCTHFNYFKPSFQRIFSKKTQFIDGNEGTIKQLLRKAPLTESDTQSVEFYFSGILATKEELQEVKTYLSRLEEVYSL
ncbi:glutamate racemase [Filifactor alocis]|uniref:glutamate racemase n=1 Tax=Filifactor alocis TaxID=143361 RepID=UPI0028D767A3|nr:glutamate racemase [Filifactor alocis]